MEVLVGNCKVQGKRNSRELVKTFSQKRVNRQENQISFRPFSSAQVPEYSSD